METAELREKNLNRYLLEETGLQYKPVGNQGFGICDCLFVYKRFY